MGSLLRALVVWLAGMLVVSCGPGVSSGHPYLGSCQPLTAHPGANGRALEDAASAFVRDVEAGDTSAARGGMTAAAQTATNEAQLAQLASMIKQQRPSGAPTVAAVYLLRFTVPPSQLAFVPCTAQGPRGGMDFVGAGPEPEQGYVVLNIETADDSESVFSVALRRQSGAWRVERVHVDPGSLGGRDAAFWWATAKKQAAAGHDLNAALLYGMAKSLLSRGPDYQPAGLADLSAEIAKAPAPPEFKGKPPYAWTLGGAPFKVAKVGVVAIDRTETLLLLIQQLPWSTDADAVRLNHRLIDAYAKAHPDWTDAFDALAVRTCRADDRCFGTVYDKGRGYEQQTTSPDGASTQ